MEYLIIILVCFFSSVAGAICGIGGGVIIKPVLALGGAAGGLTGKELYQGTISRLSDSSRVGAVQAFVLMVVTMGILIYTIYKDKIHTKSLENRAVIFAKDLTLLCQILLLVLSNKLRNVKSFLEIIFATLPFSAVAQRL